MVKSFNENSCLTTEQRKFFDDNGYVILKNFIKKDLVDTLVDHAKDICDGVADKGVINVVKEPLLFKAGAKGQYAINKLQDLCYDEKFKKYTENEDLLKVIESFLGSNITCISSMLILKPPNNIQEMSEHPLHQDQYYFPYRPANKLISVWTALTRVTPDNGCLYIIPGSHKGELHEHKYLNKDIINIGYHGAPGFEDVPRLDLVMDAGDTVFFHPLLLHGSYENRTQNFRHAINCDYSDSYVDIIDMKGTIQENICTELEEICEKRKGKCHTYVEIFQMKSKCVKGDVGNFDSRLQGQIYF